MMAMANSGLQRATEGRRDTTKLKKQSATKEVEQNRKKIKEWQRLKTNK